MPRRTRNRTEAKSYVILDKIAENILFDSLPINWQINDLQSFSNRKNLYDYQVESIKNAIKILCKYYSESAENKDIFYKLYEDSELELDIPVQNAKILKDYFDVEENKFSFKQFVNRMSFWMATGSGKTLVIIKLIEIINKLMNNGFIPKKRMLFLTYRKDLIDAFKEHVEEYNEDKEQGQRISFISLKEYEKTPDAFSGKIEVFYYRSDILSDEKKEKKLDYRDYLSKPNEPQYGGDWYLFLDEAHKGNKADSKRQHIFSILARNGFLFNFSATFTDIIDIATTVYNMNLAEFIKKGYGKQVFLFKKDISEFRDTTDLNEKAKQKVILKSFVLLTYLKKLKHKITFDKYHNPIIVTLVNSVNKSDSDLKLFFFEILNLAKNIDNNLLKQAKEELISELNYEKYLLYDGIGDGHIQLNINDIKKVTSKDIWKEVYNSNRGGAIEVIINSSKKKELAFKLTSSDNPFALINIGETSKWKNEILSEYRMDESFDDEGYFKKLNDDSSTINILLGSRTFYEGWDSNRPNIINFVNIGTGTEARKFVLQSTGRGIRIEPIKDKRKRLWYLRGKNISDDDYNQLKGVSKPLESLFIMATRKKALEDILKQLELVKEAEGFQEVSLQKNITHDDKILLIPIYKKTNKPLIEEEKPPKFELSAENYEILKSYISLIDKKCFIIQHKVSPTTFNILKDMILNKQDKYFRFNENKDYKDFIFLLSTLFNYLSIEIKKFEKFVHVGDRIVHFTMIKVKDDKLEEFKEGFENIKDYKTVDSKELEENIKSGEITFEEALKIKNKSKDEIKINGLTLKHLSPHYYIPVIYSTDERIDWIKNIITEQSEVEFIKELIKIKEDIDKKFDWWKFSKLSEIYDEKIYIPYTTESGNHKFHPDFIFWLKKDNNYRILFVDPKGTAYTNYQLKADGYSKLFKGKTFNNHKDKKIPLDLTITVDLYFYKVSDVTIPEGYKDYWIDKDSIKGIF